MCHGVSSGVTQGDSGEAGFLLKSTYLLHCLYSVELQVILAVLGHQMVNLPPVDELISSRDEPNEGGVIQKVMTVGAAAAVQVKSKK